MKKILVFTLLLLLPVLSIRTQSNIVVQYKCGETNTSANQIRPSLNIVNRSDQAVNLDELTIRYYYTISARIEQEFHISYAQIGSSVITGNIVQEWENDYYMEISFNGAGLLEAGSETGTIETWFNKSDWTEYDQSDDYSFNQDITEFTDWDHIILLQNGTLSWGEFEGGNIPPSIRITSPADSSSFLEGDNIILETEPVDQDGEIALVEFYKESTKIAEISSAPFTAEWENAPAGDHTFKAVVTDNGGKKSFSNSISITVENDEGIDSVNFSINTNEDKKEISPYIYGVNQYPDGAENLTAQRIGGNRITGYNWETNASNAGSDWSHSSDNFTVSGLPDEYANAAGGFIKYTHEQGLAHNPGMYTIMSIQAAGYAAADMDGTVTEEETAPSDRWNEVVFNKGSELSLTPDTTDNYVYMDEMVNYLVQTLGSADESGIKGYCIDNEPALWSHTHPRIHPEAATCEELIDKTVSIGKMVKNIDPSADVLGPVLYGFAAFMALQDAPDWETVGSDYSWFLDYYLDNMKNAGDQEGKRLLDVLDLHWYPEAQGDGLRIVFNDTASPSDENIKARVQAPRTLWDPNYIEDSWIGTWFSDYLPLIPTIQESIDTYYPETKLAFTEYGYGCEYHVSGGVAMADVLGIFGKYGVYLGTYWKCSDERQYVASAFNIYRNYDGANSTYGSVKVKADSGDYEKTSVYASLPGENSNELHIILINKELEETVKARIYISGSTSYTSGTSWGFDGNSPDITLKEPVTSITGNHFDYYMEPLSVYHIILHPGSSNQAPEISISQPVDSDHFEENSNIILECAASDSDGKVETVEWYANGTKIGEDTGSKTTYTMTWESVPKGIYTITAIAKDNNNGIGESSPVKITVGDYSPAVSITSPENNALLAEGDIMISASASDEDGTIISVSFYGTTGGSTILLGEDTTSPYSIVWSGLTAGEYQVYAIAEDNDSNTTISETISFETEANNPPSIEITSPQDSSVYDEGETITINAEAEDTDGSITEVIFTISDTNGTIYTSTDTTAPYTASWTADTYGNITITAQAEDNKAAITVSQAINIIVNTPVVMPVPVITSPADNETFAIGADILIQVNEGVPVNTVLQTVEFYSGTTLLSTDPDSPYEYTWTDAAEGDHEITVKSIYDSGEVVSEPITIHVTDTPPAQIIAQYKCMETNSTANSIRAYFNIINQSDTAVSMEELTLRYYYTVENDTDQEFHCDWAGIGSTNVSGDFIQITGDQYYIEISFADGIIQPGSQSGDIQARWNKIDWSMFNQSNDESWNPDITEYTDHDKIEIYQNSSKIWPAD